MSFISQDLKKIYKSLSKKYDFNYLDIGSSVPLNKYLLELCEVFNVNLYEPNIKEYNKLLELKKKTKNLDAFPYGISNKSKEKLNIYHRPNFSSIYSIDEKYNHFVRGKLRKTSTARVKCITLKTALNKIIKLSEKKTNNISNALKIDTQGHNINCLKSSGKKIDQFAVIILENDYFPIYKKQSLYFDSGKFLHENKFIRVGSICNLDWSFYKKNLKNNHLYNELESSSDVLFIKNIFENKNISNADNLSIIFFLIIFNYIDMAQFYIFKSKLNLKIKKKLNKIIKNTIKNNRNTKKKLISNFLNKKISINKLINYLSYKKEITSIFRTRI